MTHKRNACRPGPHGPTDSEMSINKVIARQSRYEVNSIQVASFRGEEGNYYITHKEATKKDAFPPWCKPPTHLGALKESN